MVFAREERAALLCAALPVPYLRVASLAELVAAAKQQPPAVAFVDVDLLPPLPRPGGLPSFPIVGLIDSTLAEAIRSFNSFPWLSDLVSTTMLAAPLASAHLSTILERLEQGHGQAILGADAVGRVALLRSSTHREARFERMREFFSAQGLSTRPVSSILDIAEELVTNALYDAPMEAGYYRAPVQRTEAVELPPEHACEISYGLDLGSLFVRVRDPFGSLSRTRLLDVLNRCNSTCVSMDESRGGAGLGIWRVFSTASTISIRVIPGRVTDLLVRVETKKGRTLGKQIFAIHLELPEATSLDGVRGRFAADHDDDLMDESFTAVRVA